MAIMSEPLNLDRQSAVIDVNKVVLFAKDDALMLGKVVYAAAPDTAQLAIEVEGKGLHITRGEFDGEHATYKNVYMLS